MDDKIQLQDLIEALAVMKGLPKKDANAFVRLLFDVIVKAIEEDKYVKIKGLGTFKQVMVESRESVDVNTGERIEIQGHSKISFTPDTALKDLINRPFSHFETVVLNDEVQDAELEDIDRSFSDSTSLLSPYSDTMKTVSSDGMKEELEPESKEPYIEVKEKPVGEESDLTESEFTERIDVPEVESESVCLSDPLPLLETEQEIPEIEQDSSGLEEENKNDAVPCENAQPVLVKLLDPVNVQLECTKSEHKEEEIVMDEEKKNIGWRRSGFWLWMLIVLLLMAGSYFVGYYHILCPDCSPKSVVIYDTVYVKEKVPVSIPYDTVKSLSDTSVTQPDKSVPAKLPSLPQKTEKVSSGHEKENQIQDTSYPQVSGGAYLITGTMQTYTIRSGETIRIIAERFFGSRQMAPYIVKYNNIADPDHVAVGTVLKIPKLEPKRR